MPELFPSTTVFVLCALVVAGAQLIYATVGFGAGMFSVALLALLLPDLAGAVVTLLILTFVTEVWVLLGAWRAGRLKLILGLLPTMAVGMWLGTELLAAGSVAGLKRALGGVVLAAGAWFLYQETRRHLSGTRDTPRLPTRRGFAWIALPAGLISGVLAGLFGTGGPPVIIFLKGYRLDKSAFRATLLWYFLIMTFVRAAGYLRAELLTRDELMAGLWLLPAALLGTVAGTVVHGRVSERQFGTVVSILLVFLGLTLAISGGK